MVYWLHWRHFKWGPCNSYTIGNSKNKHIFGLCHHWLSACSGWFRGALGFNPRSASPFGCRVLHVLSAQGTSFFKIIGSSAMVFSPKSTRFNLLSLSDHGLESFPRIARGIHFNFLLSELLKYFVLFRSCKCPVLPQYNTRTEVPATLKSPAEKTKERRDS